MRMLWIFLLLNVCVLFCVWQTQKSLQQELLFQRRLLQEGLVYQNDEEEDQVMTDANLTSHVPMPTFHPTLATTSTSPLIGQFIPSLLLSGAIAGASSAASATTTVEECLDMSVDDKTESMVETLPENSL